MDFSSTIGAGLTKFNLRATEGACPRKLILHIQSPLQYNTYTCSICFSCNTEFDPFSKCLDPPLILILLKH